MTTRPQQDFHGEADSVVLDVADARPDSLAGRLTAARELRQAREQAAAILADAEHRAGVLQGRAQLLMDEAKAERLHADRYTKLATDRAAAILDAARAEHDQILATARMKARLIVASARSEAARTVRDRALAADEITIDLVEDPAADEPA